MKTVSYEDFYGESYTMKSNPVTIRAYKGGWIVARKVGDGPKDVICRAHTGHGGVRVFRSLDTLMSELLSNGITSGSWRSV